MLVEDEETCTLYDSLEEAKENSYGTCEIYKVTKKWEVEDQITYKEVKM